MRFLFLALLMLVCGQPKAQTYSFDDNQAQSFIQQRQSWEVQVHQMLINAAKDRVKYCNASNYGCISKAIEGSRRMHNALSAVIDEWEPLFNQTNKMLTLFKQLELPENAKVTREQYRTYVFLLQQSTQSQADLLAYSKGKLGHYNNYDNHYKVNQMLAMVALDKKQKLNKVRRLALVQIAKEKKLLTAL